MFDVELGGGGISCKYYHRQYEYNQISAALLLQDKNPDCCWGVLRGCPMCAVVSIKNAFITWTKMPSLHCQENLEISIVTDVRFSNFQNSKVAYDKQ